VLEEQFGCVPAERDRVLDHDREAGLDDVSEGHVVEAHDGDGLLEREVAQGSQRADGFAPGANGGTGPGSVSDRCCHRSAPATDHDASATVTGNGAPLTARRLSALTRLAEDHRQPHQKGAPPC
jgi:hypothetical protein